MLTNGVTVHVFVPNRPVQDVQFGISNNSSSTFVVYRRLANSFRLHHCQLLDFISSTQGAPIHNIVHSVTQTHSPEVNRDKYQTLNFVYHYTPSAYSV